jgi:putative PIN family toxin of toxin-antitoxin system
MTTPDRPVTRVVLDTNIVLDVYVFNDVAARAVREGLELGQLQWFATAHMREELARVLAYAHIVPRLAYYQLEAASVLAQFDRHVCLQPPAPRALAICKDPDDQCFIDLAVNLRALLLSKDKAVTRLKKRVLALGARVQVAL